ncbi:hypothetical protein D3C81_1768350 [compost metagenome]
MSPVLHTACPFAGDIHRGQVEHFQQGFIGRKDALAFGHFPKLPMVTLDLVRRVDELADSGRYLKKVESSSQLLRQERTMSV